MKVVRKLLAPLLVVGILLTSLISLHQLKADKKKDVFRIGISQFITHQSLDATREGFVDELAKQGYVEGKNIEIDLQNAQGEQRNLKTISQQLAESSDVVLAIATPSAQSLANTTQTTPVIFSAVTDPVSAKLVESREHPGGNVTGTSDQSSDAISTQINLIKKVLPKAKTIGILYTQSEPNSVVQKDEAKRLLEEKGFTVVEKTILDSNNVKAAAESLMAEVDMVLYQRIISFHQPWKQSSRFLLNTRFQYSVVQQKWLRLVACITTEPIMKNWDVRQQECWFVS